MVKLVIFDLDGVIVDTVDFYYTSTKKVADEMGAPFSKEDNLYFQGRSRKSLVEELSSRIGLSLTPHEVLEWGNKRNRYYQELLNDLNEEHILPGMKDLLQAIHREGIPMVLASSSSNGRRVLNQLNLEHYFVHIVDPATLEKGKPAPDIFLKAAEFVGAKEEECVAIEDGLAGLTGILATNMFSVGVGPYEYLKKANLHVEDTRQLTVELMKKKYREWTK
ncbi:hypothetical protein Q75_16945 [Bacillus coahuilensis p1.1.43]|uniref:Beta-phosphoglucomutase n=1 Tax=Bacillus coahuilensis p1.1.43 TaxID=1150625 RepID=A0A147K3Y2_9BACI|nr:beta-phosphoglucomutase [Bacillus coahuilensis]KUP04002.1 hypothetical protein Q75_16945 [Bacillus coahuilensis p1.1.43]